MRWLTLTVVALLIPLTVRAADKEPAAEVKVDKEKRTVTIDAKIAPRKLEYLKGEVYPIEVIACWAHPKGQKAHETVVTIEAKPSDVHKAIESLGAKPGTPVKNDTDQPKGPAFLIYLEVPGPDGQPRKLPIEKTLVDPKTNKPMPKVEWRFTGSIMKPASPEKSEKVYAADLTGTLISIFPVTDETVFQTNLTMKQEKYLKLETNKEVLPKEGTPVKLILEMPAK